MAYFLFIDESGHDHKESPYEVLAGVAIRDQDLWNLIRSVQDAELLHFGVRYSDRESELKGKKLLKTKVFKHARQSPPIAPDERRELAKECLIKATMAGKRELTALAQAKLEYVRSVLSLCSNFRCQVFASVVTPTAPRPLQRDHLRKDYSYLFERFSYFLEDEGDRSGAIQGIVVFDELERSQSHILIGQMDRYFKTTLKGRSRARLIIPEPFFVHSELTTGVQLADLVAYIVSWGFRDQTRFTAPHRAELSDYAKQVAFLRYCATRPVKGRPNFKIWSIALIEDLRGVDER